MTDDLDQIEGKSEQLMGLCSSATAMLARRPRRSTNRFHRALVREEVHTRAAATRR